MRISVICAVIIGFIAITVASDVNDDDFVIVPGGQKFHRECVIGVPSTDFHIQDVPNGGAKITTMEGHQLLIQRCKHLPRPLHGTAWRAWTEVHYPDAPITSLYGEWQVPPAPVQNDGQTLFYWNGVEPDDNTGVLQPVLQWGASAAGGGVYWTLASWYVNNQGTAYYTPLFKVAVGDVILGTNTYNAANQSWTIIATSKKTGKQGRFNMKPLQSTDFTYGYNTLEAYNVDDCTNDYPSTNKIIFNNIKVATAGKPVTPQWVVKTQTPSCQENAQVQSPTQTSISWNS